MRRNGLDNAHVGDTSTPMDDFKMLFFSAGEVAGGNSKDTSFYYCIKVHSRFREASLENPIFKFPVFAVSPSKRRR